VDYAMIDRDDIEEFAAKLRDEGLDARRFEN
jgi:hypothetical protein